MSDRFLEQRIKITFCAKLGKNESETCGIVSEAYGRKAMKKSSNFDGHKRFKEGRKNVEDIERSDRLT
jgi:hypothetical protein